MKSKIITLFISIIIGILVFYFSKSWIYSLISIVASFALITLYIYMRSRLAQVARVRKMEAVFPDFLQLMAGNLRAGMTIDKALLLSSRKEFAPLDAEILRLGKDLVTGKDINTALNDMAARIKSEKITKTIMLINSGIKSGGNVAILLQETATNMRERDFVEKRAASNVLMYVIFIVFAISVGSPLLFGLSSVLVQVLTGLLSTIPSIDAGNLSVPFTITEIKVSVNFITYFSLIFLIVTNILGAMILGLVSKGEEKEGVKYMIPLLAVSISIFLIVKVFLAGYFTTLF